MATFLDVSGLEAFSKIFVFIFVLLVVYILFTQLKSFENLKWIAALLAIVVSLFVILSDLATGIIRTIAPWFAVLFVFATFVMIASKIFGATGSDFAQYKGIFLVVVILIFIVGSLYYVRQNTTVPGDIDEEGNVIKDKDYTATSDYILHPNILGIIFTLLVSIFTVALLAGKSS